MPLLFFFDATSKHGQHPLVSFLTPFLTSIVNVFPTSLGMFPNTLSSFPLPHHPRCPLSPFLSFCCCSIHSHHSITIPLSFVLFYHYYWHPSLSFTISHHYFYCIIVPSPFVESRKNVTQTQNPNHELEFYQGHPTFGCLGCWHLILKCPTKDKMCATLVYTSNVRAIEYWTMLSSKFQ